MRVIGTDRLGFLGRISCTCAAHVHAKPPPVNDSSIPSMDVDPELSATQGERLVCTLMTVDGDHSMSTLVLQRSDESGKYRLVACNQERTCDDIECLDKGQQQSLVLL